MKPLLLYPVESLLCSGALLLFYRLVLLRKVAFTACRRYLVAAVLLAALLPALNIPLYPARGAEVEPAMFVAVDTPPVAATALTPGAAPLLPAEATAAGTSFRWERAGAILYATICTLSALLLTIRLYRIRRLRCCARLTDCGDYTLAEHPSVCAPFSFLRTIFLGEEYERGHREVVLRHEVGHVRHRHSAERITVEAVRCLLWFNPFVWMLGRHLEEVQEWEVDREVLDAGYDLTAYRLLILQQLFGYNPDISCGLNHSLTKNRFIMMTQPKTYRHGALRLGAAALVAVGMMLLCSFTTREPETPETTSTIHIPAEGEIQMSGEERTRFEAEGEAVKMVVQPTSEPASTPATKSVLVAEITLTTTGGMLLNGREVTAEELKTELAALRAAGWTGIYIKAEEGVKMGSVTDLKELLRETKNYNVRYTSPDGEKSLTRTLSPASEAGQEEPDALARATSPSEQRRIKERNLYRVMLNRNGKLLAGPGQQLEPMETEQLTVAIKAFLKNTSGSAGLSEQLEIACKLPDGRTPRYRQSQGVVTLTCDATTSYNNYLRIQQAITAAYNELRDGLSREWFSRDYATLSLQERKAVAHAIPLRISEAEPHRANGL